MTRNALIAVLLLTAAALGADPYYKVPEIFSLRPDPTKSSYTITRFGPVGISIDLIQPAFTMKIAKVEKGSPAEAAGLTPGLIIQSVNGEKLADIDPRIQLGNMITKAEAKDGRVVLMVSDKLDGEAKEVVVQIPALGAYSETWPLNCPKSEKIVRDYAEYLKKPGANLGLADMGMLFLLSTGDEADLATVREWARSRKPVKQANAWHVGYGSVALCEYYLRTGDEQVLPVIQSIADAMVLQENFGGWAGRGAMAGVTYGGGNGHMNAAGCLTVAYLLLAKECGANIPEANLNRILAHFYRWAGRGTVPYGNNLPEKTYTDNGRNGKLAFAMAAAAALTPDGEKSIYARARDTNALFSFYSTAYLLHGHTGGGIGEVSRSQAMGLLYDKFPNHYREFMNQRSWHYDISRRFDGSFGIVGGDGYDKEDWGVGYAMTYTVPRKTLRITGAPPTKFSKLHKLPERPWGTAEDDEFESTTPIAFADGTLPDFSKETIVTDAGIAANNRRVSGIDADALRRYIRHPDYNTRWVYAAAVAPHGPSFVAELLASDDARARRTGLDAIVRAPDPLSLLDEKNRARILKLIKDPNESLFVKEAALGMVGRFPVDEVVANVDLLLPYLKHEEWWLQHGALAGLSPAATDVRAYKQVLPAIGEFLQAAHLYNSSAPLRSKQLTEQLSTAAPEVQALAKSVLTASYTRYIDLKHPIEDIPARVNSKNREQIATLMTKVEGGYDSLYQVAKGRTPGHALPYEDLFLSADQSRFSPELKQAVGAAVKERLIPQFVAKNRQYLLGEVDSSEPFKPNFYLRRPAVEDLADLYQELGVADYAWRHFGPAIDKMSWHYLNFDPPEQLAWDSDKPRWRKITLPQGAENWFKPEFDPAQAGWKTGLQPFGAQKGELAANLNGECNLAFCECDLPMQTLWDKEVMLLRGKFKFPPFEEGHRYRLVMGGMSHVNAGEGYQVYVNGKLLMERPRGVGKREGAQPLCQYIDKSWWPDFEKEVDIAVISFMANSKGVKRRSMSVWMQAMKSPPVGEAEIRASVSALPMTSSAWQALQDPENAELEPDQGLFRFDGQFQPNDAVLGKWKTIAITTSPDEYQPKSKPGDLRKAPVQELTFKPDGKTESLLWMYTGDTLMNLSANQALKMVVRKTDGQDLLFVEVGGFNAKNGPTWKSPWFVMAKAQ